MVLTWQSSDKTTARVLARGNFSLDAGGLLNLLLALAVVSLSPAGLLAWQGYWPILLIAVIQLALVASYNLISPGTVPGLSSDPARHKWNWARF